MDKDTRTMAYIALGFMILIALLPACAGGSVNRTRSIPAEPWNVEPIVPSDAPTTVVESFDAEEFIDPDIEHNDNFKGNPSLDLKRGETPDEKLTDPLYFLPEEEDEESEDDPDDPGVDGDGTYAPAPWEWVT